MQPILYFFGTFNGQQKSYPLDHTKEIFTSAIKHSKNSSQIILIRKGNLLYYCYVYKVNSQQLFGICLCMDCIYADIHKMFQVFDAIYARLMQDGKIVGIDSKGCIKFLIKDYSEESVEIQEVYNRLKRELDINERNSIILPPIDLSVSIDSFLELSLENDSQERIVDASKHYSNLYIVRKQSEIERVTGFSNVVKGLCKEKETLTKQIREDQEQIEKLKRQKKQTTFVLILLCIIVLGGILVYNYATDTQMTINQQSDEIEVLRGHVKQLMSDSIRLDDSLSNVRRELSTARTELKQKDSELKEKETTIESLRENVSSLEKRLENTKITLNNTKNQLDILKKNLSNTPFVINEVSVANVYYGGDVETSYGSYLKSSTSMYLKPKISYYGLIPGNKTIYMKLLYPSGALVTLRDNKSPKGYTNKYNINITKGENSLELEGLGDSNKGYWSAGKYKYEFYCDGILIGSHEFYVH